MKEPSSTVLSAVVLVGPRGIQIFRGRLERWPGGQAIGRPVFYCNRTVRSFLRRQIANKVAQSTLTMDTVAGKRVVAFDDIPVKRCDQILNSESTVS